MKKMIAVTLALALFLFTLPALAEDDHTVTALGTATVTLVPDMATFTAGVSTQDMLVSTAQAANATAMQTVLDAIKALGVAEEDIQTDNYSISPVYDYRSGANGDQQVLVGYSVTNNVEVTVHDIDLLPALLDAAVAAGANQSYGISFSSSQSNAAYDQALTAATQDALRKATLIATALGKNIGNVLTVEEANDTYVPYASNKAIAYAADSTPIQSGTVSVSANVQIQATIE